MAKLSDRGAKGRSPKTEIEKDSGPVNGNHADIPSSVRHTVTIVPGQGDRLERALSGFVDRVREAALIYDRDRDRSESAGRLGCIGALTAAIDLCQAIGLSAGEDRTFFHLFVALQDAEAGIENELLSRTELGRKAPTSLVVMRQRGYVAAAIELLIKDGKSLKDATIWVGKKAHQHKLSALKSTHTKKSAEGSFQSTVKGWRDRAMAGQYSVDWDTTTFRDACDAMETFGLRGEAAAERLISDAGEIG